MRQQGTWVPLPHVVAGLFLASVVEATPRIHSQQVQRYRPTDLACVRPWESPPTFVETETGLA